MYTPDQYSLTSTQRALVTYSNSATGEIKVKIPSLLGGTSEIFISKVGRKATSGVWAVPDVASQIVVSYDDQHLTNVFWMQTDLSNIQEQLNTKAPLASPTFTGTVAGITKAMVGLGSVDNTTDTAKPISTAQQTALDLKANIASPTFTGNANFTGTGNGYFTGAIVASGAPSVDAVRSTDLSYNNAAQNVPIRFDYASPNIGNYYNTSTGLLTAPFAGDYFISCGVFNSAYTNVNQLWIVKNGARDKSIALAPEAGMANMTGSGIQRLGVGDTLGMAAWFGGASATITANNYHTFLRIRYLG